MTLIGTLCSPVADLPTGVLSHCWRVMELGLARPVRPSGCLLVLVPRIHGGLPGESCTGRGSSWDDSVGDVPVEVASVEMIRSWETRLV